VAVNFTEHEYCEIVQGVSVLRDNDGNSKTVRAGDRFVIPAGFRAPGKCWSLAARFMWRLSRRPEDFHCLDHPHRGQATPP
jgi:hypothetical protein